MFHKQAQTTLNGKNVLEAGAAGEPGDFVTEELCQARRDGLMKDCGFHADRIKALERKQDIIDSKITATLVSVILLLVSIVVLKFFGVSV